METEWKIARGQGKCMSCEKLLKEDDIFFSALLESGDQFTRKDFCPECWESQKEPVFSFWKTRVAKKGAQVRPMVDNEVLLDFFRRLEPESEPAKVNFRYLLGLILMRKKVLKFEDIARESGQEFLVLRQTGDQARHRVLDPKLPEEELEKLKDNLHQVLYLEAS